MVTEILILIFIGGVIFIFSGAYHFIIYICRISFQMDPEDAKFMRTERRPGSIDVHPNIDAIVLNYEVDVQILGPKENVIHGEKKNLKKIIELPMINSRTDCHALSKEVVNHCDLIHHSRLAEVEQIIYYLKKRKLQTNGKNDPTLLYDNEKNDKNINGMQEGNYNHLPEYIDLLYEGMAEKIKGAHYIQFLARDSTNLEALAKNETLISALGRVLREDWKRSIALSTHLVFTFFCFSMYSCFHEIILKCKYDNKRIEIKKWFSKRLGTCRSDDDFYENFLCWAYKGSKPRWRVQLYCDDWRIWEYYCDI